MKKLQTIKNIILKGAEGKPIALDIFYKEGPPLPVVIYAHGFNGFKDWGNFDLIAHQFADAGFLFIKFNFSHNGTTPEQPEDFVDLEAYGNNNCSKELEDLQHVIDWTLDKHNPYAAYLDSEKLFLIGHSWGGGIVLLKACEEQRVKKVTSWASVSECKTPWGSWPPDKIDKWKETGEEFYTNSRTKQQLPLYYQLYEDYIQNEKRLNIKEQIKHLNIPVLICHGTEDEAVPVNNAEILHAGIKESTLFLVKSDHVFGRKHPWNETALPHAMQEVVNRTIEFLRK